MMVIQPHVVLADLLSFGLKPNKQPKSLRSFGSLDAISSYGVFTELVRLSEWGLTTDPYDSRLVREIDSECTVHGWILKFFQRTESLRQGPRPRPYGTGDTPGTQKRRILRTKYEVSACAVFQKFIFTLPK